MAAAFVLIGFQVIIALWGIKKPGKIILKESKQYRFGIVISARNEQEVISNLIKSLDQQDYPRELFDIIIIADNCTDDTAQVARDSGALVFERFDKKRIGKGYALNWMFDILLSEYPEKYDAICIFDADNVVSTQFLTMMNQRIADGCEIVQGYRDVKNPYASAISGHYTIYWYTFNRLLHLPRVRIGLSSMLNGTGFVFKTDVIREKGWQAMSESEDAEFSLQNIAEGRKIDFEYNAVFYDEQPTSFLQSLSQRHRWAVGNYHCISSTGGDLVRGIFRGKRLLNMLDAIVFLLLPPIVGLTGLSMIIDLIIPLIQPNWGLSNLLSLLLVYSVGMFVMILTAIIVLLLEKKLNKKMWKAILTIPLFLFSFSFVAFFALIYRPRNSWKPIKHTQSISLEELERRK